MNPAAALNQKFTLSVTSDTDLCTSIAEVNTAAATAAKAAKPPVQKAALPPAPKAPSPIPGCQSYGVQAAEILLTLGAAFLPPPHVQMGLADVHWAIARYAYLIDAGKAGNSGLRLKGSVADYRFHHKTSLSEAFGVGCSLTYAHAWLTDHAGEGAVVYDPVDVEFVISGVITLPGAAAPVIVKPAPNAARRPDYVVVAEKNNNVRLLVVECKGNSARGLRSTHQQLATAMHQLAGVEFHTPGLKIAWDSHAYAARLPSGTGGVKIYGVDPPAASDPWFAPTAPARAPDTDAMDPTAALAMSWAGARDGREPSDLAHHESAIGELRGARSTFALADGGRLSVFTGVPAELLAAAGTDDHDRFRAQQKATRERVQAVRSSAEAAQPPHDALDREADVPRTERADPARPFAHAGSVTSLVSDEEPENLSFVVSNSGLVLRLQYEPRAGRSAR